MKRLFGHKTKNRAKRICSPHLKQYWITDHFLFVVAFTLLQRSHRLPCQKEIMYVHVYVNSYESNRCVLCRHSTRNKLFSLVLFCSFQSFRLHFEGNADYCKLLVSIGNGENLHIAVVVIVGRCVQDMTIY